MTQKYLKKKEGNLSERANKRKGYTYSLAFSIGNYIKNRFELECSGEIKINITK